MVTKNTIAGLCFLSLVAQQSAIADEAALNNGYAGVTPKAAALIRSGPTLSQKLERDTDRILSKKDGVSAAVGAALTATLTSNPAAVLVGGLAGIWVGEKEIAYCGCNKMQLGEQTSGLFRRVSRSLFKGGRKLGSKTKELAKKAGKAINRFATAGDPMPLTTAVRPMMLDADTEAPFQLRLNPEDQLTKPNPELKKAEPVIVQKIVKPVLPVVMQQPVKKKERKKKPVVVATKKPKKKSVKVKAKKKVKSLTNNTGTKLAKKKPMPKAIKKKPKVVPVAVAQATDRQVFNIDDLPKKILPRANNKNLQDMPKVDALTPVVEPMQPWPEPQLAAVVKREPLTTRIKGFEKPRRAIKPYVPNPNNLPAQKSNRKVSTAPDCDTNGDKISRGRLAWMECYYRMGVD